MKSLVKSKPQPGIWMQEVPQPHMGPNDILVRISKTAICGTDIHIYNWDDWASKTIPIPMTIGHEFVGEIERVGDEVVGFSPGDRVSGEGHITCGHCRNCRAGKRHLCRNTKGIGVNQNGCFAEYLSIPASNAFLLPEQISDQEASILDPLGNATHAALSFDLIGEDVLISGAGPIGCMATAICKYVGARHVVVTDLNAYRLELASRLGATRTINIQKETIQTAFRELEMKEGFDIGLEMSGSPEALRSLLEAINHGGSVALLGIPPKDTAIDWDLVIFKGLVLKGIYGREIFETWYKMSTMLQSGLDVKPIITHNFPLNQYIEAFEVVRSGMSGKVILDWK